MSESTSPPPANRGWRRYLLLGSLCLNVALAGYIGAQLWFFSDVRPRMLAQPGQMVERIASRLPPADGDLVRKAYAERSGELAAARAEFRISVVRLLATMARPDMTPEALRAAIDDARAKRARQNELLTGFFIEAVGKMSPEGRREMVSRVHRAVARFGEMLDR